MIASETSDDVNFLAERSHMIGGGENAPGEYLIVLVARRDDVFLGRLTHRNDVLIFIDDGVADEDDAVVLYLFDKAEDRIEAAIIAKSRQMVADVRFENIEVPVDQLGRAEGNFIGELDRAAVRFNRIAFQR